MSRRSLKGARPLLVFGLVAILPLGCSDDVDGSTSTGPTTGAGASGGSTSTSTTTTSTGGEHASTSTTVGGAGGGEPVDPTFSFIVVPDTQNETLNDTNAQKHFNPRLEWILANRDALDVRFVLQTGDLCNWDTPTHDQYERASAGFALLDRAGLPYALAIGNHDTAATCIGGSACPGDTHARVRDTSTFNQYFPITRFPTMAGTFEPDKVDNAFHLFRAGNADWIVVSMELWARTAAYEWVGQVLEDHPNHNAIVFTHDHLTGAGQIQTSNGGYGDNSPRKIFDDVLSLHANVRFIFSGHEGLTSYRDDTGTMGNHIHQFLFNIDDGSNPTRVVTVDTEADTSETYVYGPATDHTYDQPGTSVSITNADFLR